MKYNYNIYDERDGEWYECLCSDIYSDGDVEVDGVTLRSAI